MRKTIAPAEMKRVETYVMEHTAITGEQLMQRAAAHVADTVERLIRSQKVAGVLCICGCGNNGGDGMAAMRMLAQRMPALHGECWILPGRLSLDAVRELERLAQTDVRIVRLEDRLPKIANGCGCIIDAMFGTGLCRPLEGLAAACCRLINAAGCPTVAVDIPSGLSGLTGEVLGEAVAADVTVTFHRPKPGLYLQMGPDHAGHIEVAEIGLPAKLDDADGFDLLETEDLSRLLPQRKRVSHKGNYGRVLLWAGSRGMAGAAAIAATAALRTGAGLVTVACPECVVDIVQVLAPCATCLPLPENVEEAWVLLEAAIRRCDALGAGCGLGKSEWAARLLEQVVRQKIPMVLDADALNLLAERNISADGAFFTPHPAEAARLLGCSVEEVLRDAPAASGKLAQYNPVILKGACSVLNVGGRMAINPYGTPGMAKGGSGDALTGVMAALLAGRKAGAYSMTDLELMQTACALHGLAGEMAVLQHGERGMLATDLCDCLGRVAGKKPNIPFENPEEFSEELGRRITVVVEHGAGSQDEADRELHYALNCGYAQEILQERNEWQDACIWGESRPLEWYEGRVLATAQIGGRNRWVVGPEDLRLNQEQVRSALAFWGDADEVYCL